MIDPPGPLPQTYQVRLPVDLPPRLHRELAAWCGHTARLLDVPAVPRTDVLRALLEQLVTDPLLAAVIRDRVADQLHADQHVG